MVLEMDGEDQFDRSREKKASVIKSKGGEEYPANNKKKEGRLTELVTSCIGTAFYNTLLKERYREGQKWREDEDEDVSSYWMTLKKREGTGN